MRIEHLAIWAGDLALLTRFYTTYFDCTAGDVYENKSKAFTSCFLSFGEGLSRIELMHMPAVAENRPAAPCAGYAHIAVSVGDREKVDALTERLRADGYEVLSEPRTTGDGYYESVIADPEGNRVEITV